MRVSAILSTLEVERLNEFVDVDREAVFVAWQNRGEPVVGALQSRKDAWANTSTYERQE